MARNDNELAVSADELSQAGAAMLGRDAVETALTAESEAPSELDETIEVDNPFWDQGDAAQRSKDETPKSETKTDAPKRDGAETITYKANGKEVKISVAEAAKKLALVDGAQKAFSEKAKLQEKLQKVESDTAELAKYKETWERLEGLKGDKKRLYEVITGERFDDMLTREREKQDLYAKASPEARAAMDAEERIRALEASAARDREDRDSKLKQAEEREYNAESKYMQTQLEREFFKYQFPEDNPNVSNQLKRMLWRSSVADIKELSKGSAVTPEIVAKAFRDNAKALQSFYRKEVDKGVSATLDKKKKDAEEKAQIASTRNYEQPAPAELAKKNPMDLFNMIRNRK